MRLRANNSVFLGAIIVGLVLQFGVFSSVANAKIYMDPHALILVLGGTLAVAFLSIPLNQMMDLGALLVFGVFFSRKRKLSIHALELLEASVIANEQGLSTCFLRFSHPFAREAFVTLKKEFLTEDDVVAILCKRADYFKKQYLADARALQNLARFPPAFGLLGASTGMIAMMTGLGQGGQDKIGPAMAIALVATFWGIAFANLVILPLADLALRLVQEDQAVRHLVVEAARLIKIQADPRLVAEKLAAHLPPHEKILLLDRLPPLARRSMVRVVNPPSQFDAHHDAPPEIDLGPTGNLRSFQRRMS